MLSIIFGAFQICSVYKWALKRRFTLSGASSAAHMRQKSALAVYEYSGV